MSGGETPFIATENLRKTFGDREVVRGVNINVKAGEVVGLLGHSQGHGHVLRDAAAVAGLPAEWRDVTLLRSSSWRLL